MANRCYISPNVAGYPILETFSCSLGFYCPNSTQSAPESIPQVCTAKQECQLNRMFGVPCEPQGDYEPAVCMPGYYCPTDKQRLLCPPGYFCPTGTIEPRDCGWMSSCPGGSKMRSFYGGLVMCLIFDLVILLLYLLMNYRHRSAARSSKVDEENAKPKEHHLKEAIENNIEENIQMSCLAGDPELLAGYLKAFQVSQEEFRNQLAIDLKFKNLKLKLADGKSILQDVSGHIKPGRLSCIMGPSGSGKTTCMSVLMGKVSRTGGDIWLNGVQHELSSIKSIIGYVPQEDIMLREMTVRENIRYSAATRLPFHWKSREIDQFVDAIISTLGLSHVQHSLIGDEVTRGISGGQRKRVNIGMELATAPLMMFCDEPTSGLDSTAALKVVTTLKSISKLGVSVITVLHQPRFEIFEQFDDIILIFPGGRIAYFGPRQDAQSYFESLGYIFDPRVNPADVFMDILSGESKLNNSKIKLADLCDNWEQKNSPVETEPQKMSEISKLVRVSSPFWYQFWLAHNRSLIQQCRNIKSLILEIGVAILAGSLIGLSVMGSGGQMFHGIYKWPYSLISPAPIVWVVPLLGLLTSTAVGLAGAPAGVKTFGEERVVFWREAAVGHNRFSYYTGKSVSVLYRILLTSLHFSSIYYYLAAPIISFGKEYAIIFLLFYCVYGLSSIISMIVRREDAPLLAVVACLFSSVFCGFGPSLVDAKGWGLLWFWEISYAKHATEAMLSEESQPFKLVYDIVASTSGYGYTLGDPIMNFIYMFIIGSVMRVISFVLMICLNREKQR